MEMWAAGWATVQPRLLRFAQVFGPDPLTFHYGVPHQAWELDASSALGLEVEVLRYVVTLFASVLVTTGIQVLRGPTARHVYSALSGAALLYYAFGAGVIHALVPTALTYAAMAYAPRRCCSLAWAINMLYLQYVHIANMTGPLPPATDFTGSQMVLFLKLIATATAFQDHMTRAKKGDMTPYQLEHAVTRLPSPLQFVSYALGMGSLLAGPHVEYVKYTEFIEGRGVWSPQVVRPSSFVPGCITFIKALLFLLGHLYLVPAYGLATLFTDRFMAMPGVLKCFAMAAAGFTTEFKYCFAWMLAEAGCVWSGLGFEGWDAKTGKALGWGRCSNVSYFTMMFTAESTRDVARYWNKATGNFLRVYVYERLARKGRKAGFWELLGTQLINAAWHGVAPRYLLFFVHSVFFLHFSSIIWRFEALLPSAATQHKYWSLPWRGLKVLWTNFIVGYSVLGFMIIGTHNTWALWGVVNYWPNIVIVAGSLLGGFLLPARREAGARGQAGKVAAKVE